MADENMAAPADVEAQADGGATDAGSTDNVTTEETPTTDSSATEESNGSETTPTATATDSGTSSRNGAARPSWGDPLGGPALVAQEAAPRKDVPNGRAYEIIYIVRAGNPEGADQTATRVRALIEDNGGAVDNLRTSEARRTAYAIEKQIEGIYVVVNARFTKETSTELDRFFKLDENVLRHMILREDT
ncbi:MAG: 30S ribosomal protein S6 [Abitibacteriaceae bacterium]|nr:30S ribosomal protein S6 [Abditibacteriaceae bacterium]MBV9868205.1 30S ribosomal protein S6 [Abditibacteriaceae bacterium]